MKTRAINPGEIDEGLDRHNLTQIHKRFLAINDNRLQRLRSALNDRQRLIFDALPLLFHTNHPMMPGFVSRDTPSRLSNYKIDKAEIALGRQIARSFTANIELEHQEEIYGIYVMGSVGTIAQSEKSDLDIWLCFKPGLSRKAIENLNEKCTRISTWAMRTRLEVHFFLMDNEAFKRGKLSALNEESSGSAQRLLLLDEFYRTAIYIGGRKPLWWFVPPSQEKDYSNYSQTLLQKRFLRAESVIDFGGLANIPDGEFVGAGIWQLYKAIESPYKSALKLLLLEAYAHQHPNIEPLSLAFKSRVYEGELNIDELDSYMMIYRGIENYLSSSGASKRLELARRCFYFKVNKPLSKPPRGREKSWQRKLLERLAEDWLWQDSHIELLDKRAQWKAPRVADERALLVTELNHSYRFIQQFAVKTGATRAISADELMILGRKLQAAFEQKPGKVEWINPGISSDLSEAAISLSEYYDKTSKQHGWTAFAKEAGTSLQGEGEAIKSSNSFVELILWLYFNGVIDSNTFFELQNAPSISEFNLHKLLISLHQWMPLPLAALSHESFKQASEPTNVMLLLNVGSSPTPHLDEQGIQRLSNNADALRYSGFEENLVAAVDIVIRNSWNEVSTRRFEGPQAMIHCLKEYLQLCMPGSHQSPPELTVECVGSQHAATITTRVNNWFKEILQCYYGGLFPANTRYIFEMAGEYISLQFKGPRLRVKIHSSSEQLVDFLGASQPSISPIMIDSRALSRHPLRVITHTISAGAGGRSWSGAIHVFYQRFDLGMEAYVIDEFGSVIHRQFQRSKFTPLRPLHRFLRAVVSRQTRLHKDMLYDFGIFPIHFYELSQVGSQFQVEAKRVSSELNEEGKFEVKAVAQTSVDDQIVFDFYCDDQAFSGTHFGKQIYRVVGQHILKLREGQSAYPLYITDLDLSQCTKLLSENHRLTTAHYLRIKHQLESRLNHAIGLLKHH
ncbi:adenylate cyclase, class 1 [Alteromonadaceae bacterium Bs31]|nr:adenylate cyclase, class 1 [Alteromonadaceae bacterium Bs31]